MVWRRAWGYIGLGAGGIAFLQLRYVDSESKKKFAHDRIATIAYDHGNGQITWFERKRYEQDFEGSP